MGGVGGSAGAAGSGHGVIDIYLAGDLTPVNFVDGLSGQTPTNYSTALSEFQIMASAVDPNPVLCFSHAQPVIADMAVDNWVGTCDTATIPTNGYTYGRVKADWAQYTVAGTLHTTPTLVGEYTFFRAYSDTTYQGTDYLAGEGTIRFVAGAFDQTYPWRYAALPSGGDISYEVIDGEFWMTFSFTRVLPVEQGGPEKHWARLNWQTYEAFRWSELAYAGYTTGAWDTSSVITLNEPVRSPGVNGYYVTSSSD